LVRDWGFSSRRAGRGREFLHFGFVELAGDHELRIGSAVELGVELADVVERDLFQIFDLLFYGGACSAHRRAGNWRWKMTADLERGQHLRLAPAGFDGGNPLLAHLLEFGFRKRGLAQDFSGQAKRARQVGLHRLDGGLALLIPPETLRRAFRRVGLIWICWRVLFLVPRMSKPPASCAAADLPNSDFSSPNRTTTCATTVPPRVVLGSSTTFIPLASFGRGEPAFDIGRSRVEYLALGKPTSPPL